MNRVIGFIKSRCWLWIILCLYGVLVIPFVFSVTQTVFSADDFSQAVALKRFISSSGSYLFGLVRFVIDRWKTWSGRWICAFFPVGINPLVVADNPSAMLKIEMAVAFFVFVMAFVYMLNCIQADIFGIKNKKIRFLVSWMILVVFLNTNVYSEIFYWLTGVVYTVMTVFEMLAVSYAVRYFKNENGDRYTIRYAITGFCACNNLHAIVVLFVIFLYFELKKLRNKGIHIRDITLFILFVLSAALNILAPGNFIRHEAWDSTGLHPIQSLYYTFYGMIKTSLDTCATPIVIIFIICTIIVGIVLKRKGISFTIAPHKVALFALIGMIGVIYPVSMGYSNAWYPNRVIFVITAHFIVFIFMFFLSLGNGYIANKILNTSIDSQSIIRTISVVLSICLLTIPFWLKDTPYYIMISDYFYDEYTSAQWKNVFLRIENSEDDEIVIDTSGIRKSRILKEPELSSDPNDWVNRAVSEYYGKMRIVAIKE